MTMSFRCGSTFKTALGDDQREPPVRRPSRALIHEFATRGVTLPDDVLLEVVRPGWAWNLVQKVGSFRRYCYSVAWDHDAYLVWQRTPSGEGSDLFYEPVFSLWLPSTDRDAEVFIAQLQAVASIDSVDVVTARRSGHRGQHKQYFRTGRERAKLVEAKQRRKWDYYFRPARHRIGLAQKRQIWQIENRLNANGRWIGRRKLSIGLLSGAALLLAIVLAANDSQAGWLFLVIAGYFDVRWLWDIHKRTRESAQLSEWTSHFQAEIRALEQQIPNDVPSDEEIQNWLNSEVRELSKIAFGDLRLDESQLLRLDHRLNPNGACGIPIVAWGLIQPARLPGRANLNPFHLWSLWPGQDLQPRHAVYYVQLIFPMEKQLAVCGFYYDFVHCQRRGESVAEYFYRNVVSVRSDTVEEPNPLDPGRQRETVTFQLQVASRDAIVIALTDETIVSDLNARLQAREEIRQEVQAQLAWEEAQARGLPAPTTVNGTRLSDEEFGRRLEVAEADLPATVGRNARDFILRELRARG